MPRPKSANPITPTERTAAWRKGRRREIVLSEAGATAAERLMAERQVGFAPLVEMLLAEAVGDLSRP